MNGQVLKINQLCNIIKISPNHNVYLQINDEGIYVINQRKQVLYEIQHKEKYDVIDKAFLQQPVILNRQIFVKIGVSLFTVTLSGLKLVLTLADTFEFFGFEGNLYIVINKILFVYAQTPQNQNFWGKLSDLSPLDLMRVAYVSHANLLLVRANFDYYPIQFCDQLCFKCVTSKMLRLFLKITNLSEVIYNQADETIQIIHKMNQYFKFVFSQNCVVVVENFGNLQFTDLLTGEVVNSYNQKLDACVELGSYGLQVVNSVFGAERIAEKQRTYFEFVQNQGVLRLFDQFVEQGIFKYHKIEFGVRFGNQNKIFKSVQKGSKQKMNVVQEMINQMSSLTNKITCIFTNQEENTNQ
ncbi:Hypothetical_protein [Hexamita inflata]|uniref:Hypothetical_protein n=1 Tax=Hexamita inflata TaxID=28002 RepID=A0ABP1GYZ2_9EUKA